MPYVQPILKALLQQLVGAAPAILPAPRGPAHNVASGDSLHLRCICGLLEIASSLAMLLPAAENLAWPWMPCVSWTIWQ